MVVALLLLLIQSVVLVCAVSEGVLSLTVSSFEPFLNAHERVMVQWHAPWCASCTAARPELEATARDLAEKGYDTKIAKIDATAEKFLASKFDISGPTLQYFVRGEKAATYTGDEKHEALISYLTERERPEVLTLNESQVQAFIIDAEVEEFSLVARVKEGSIRHQAFIDSLSSIMDALVDSNKIRFGVVWLSKGRDPKKDASLFMQRNSFEEPDTHRIMFEGAWSKRNIANWATKGAYPTVGRKFTPKYEPKELLKQGFTGAVVLCHSVGEPQEKPIVFLRRFAQAYPLWKFTVCELTSATADEKQMLLGGSHRGEAAGITTTLSAILAETSGQDRKYQRYVLEGYDVIYDASVVEHFLADAKRGAPEYLRFLSEPPLANEVDTNGVVTLTGDTFQVRTRDSTKDYFVDFWHPRCDHCKELEVVWEELARIVKQRGWGRKGVVIAKMDMSKNDCPEVVTTFPKVVLYPAVPASKKMKKKQLWVPSHVSSYSAMPVKTLVDFLLATAVNLEGEEDAALEKDISASVKKSRQGKAATRLPEL